MEDMKIEILITYS